MPPRQARSESRAHTLLCLLSAALLAGLSTAAVAQTAPAGEGEGGTGMNAAAPATGAPANGAGEEAAPAAAAPAGRPFGFTRDLYVDLSETYETNPLGLRGYSAGAKRGGDAYTALSVGLGLHDHTVRFTGDLQYAATGSLYLRNSAYDQLYNYLNALGVAVIVPEHLLLHASAFAAPILVNALGPIAAPGLPAARGVNSGMRDTYGYSVAPEFAFRLGNFARSDAVVSDSGVFFVQPTGPAVPQLGVNLTTPSRLNSYSAVERLSSGSDFARLNWTLSGSFARLTEPGISFDQADGTVDLGYAITREFAVLGTAGYQSFHTNQVFSHKIDGPVLLGGFRFGLGPRLQASFRAGEQFRRPSYVGDVYYEITPLTTFTFSLTDVISTPASGVLGTLGNLGVNNAGNFYNTGYQLGPGSPPSTITGVSAFTPSPANLGILTDVLSRGRTATASLVHIADRTQYRLTAYWTEYDAVVLTTALSSQRTAGGEIAASRNINPFLTGDLSLDYAAQNVLGGNFATVSASATLGYLLGPVTRVYFRAAYSERLTNSRLIAVVPSAINVSDTAITIGIRRQF